MAVAASSAEKVRASEGTRWGQLVFGIICMVMIANLQYGWTLFVGPIDQKYHWGRAAIQVAFTIFVLTETWLVPIEGYLIDKFGPRAMVSASGVLVAIAWVINSVRRLASHALSGRSDRRYRRRRGLRRCGRQRSQVVPRSTRSCGRSDGGRLRRGLGADGHSDRQHDCVERLSGCFSLVRPRTGHRRDSGRPAAARAGARRSAGKLGAVQQSRRDYEWAEVLKTPVVLRHVRDVRAWSAPAA